MADGSQVERLAVMSACGKHRAIAQSRCLGLTGTDIHIYIHTYSSTCVIRRTMGIKYYVGLWRLSDYQEPNAMFNNRSPNTEKHAIQY